MGFVHGTYHFYGAHVPREWWSETHPWDEATRVTSLVQDLGVGDKSVQLGALSAGDYDRDMLFLTVRVNGLSLQVGLGEFRLSPQLPVQHQWDTALRILAAEAGYPPGKLVCGWITVPDCS